MDWEVGASGYAAVWATENTRESLWDAMERKETYATTGPRMIVRFFGGCDFDAADAQNRKPARSATARACRWAAICAPAPAGKAPTLPRRRAQGPDRREPRPLTRSSRAGSTRRATLHEKVYDVAWSGDRKPDPKTGKLPSVGNTVDVANATWTNTIGAPELIAVWKDPDFDPAQRAFYYGARDRDPDAALDRLRREALRRHSRCPARAMTLQERAYTSPIWYTPN